MLLYPNENVKLRKGGRESAKISSSEFIDLIKNAYKKIKNKEGEIEWEWNEVAWLFYMNSYLPKFRKDLKYEFDFENTLLYSNKNIEFDEKDIRHTVGGTPYLELICGGDWEDGLIVYVYPSSDGVIRAYIPSKGNQVRTDIKCVFGSETEVNFAGDEEMENRISYLKQYANEDLEGEEEIETEINIDWCLEDFETRLGERS